MRPFLSILLITLFSCRGEESANNQAINRFEIKLIDGLGTISLVYPPRTDTFFSWIQKSDCGKPCEKGDYRFQLKSNPIFMETGFFWTGEPIDSVEQLTIYHQRTDSVFKNNDSSIIKVRDRLINNVLQDLELGDVLSDTILNINDRHFLVIKTADFNKYNHVRQRRLIAFTSISGTIVQFNYKLLTTKYDSVLTRFHDRSLNNLKTVIIKDGG